MATEQREATFDIVFDLAHLAKEPAGIVISPVVKANLDWLVMRKIACAHVENLNWLVQSGHTGLTILWETEDVEAFLLT